MKKQNTVLHNSKCAHKVSASVSKGAYVCNQTIIEDGGAHVFDDRNFCVVAAFAIAYGIPYERSYTYAESAGRKHADGFWISKLLEESEYDYKQLQAGMTIHDFLKEQRQGRFIASIYRHTFAVIDGKIYDTKYNKPGSKIRHLYKVESKRLQYLNSR